MKTLNKVIFRISTVGDGLDHNTNVFASIVGPGNVPIAKNQFSGITAKPNYEITLNLLESITEDQLFDGTKQVQFVIIPGRNDKWEFDCEVEFIFSDQSNYKFKHKKVTLAAFDAWPHWNPHVSLESLPTKVKQKSFEELLDEANIALDNAKKSIEEVKKSTLKKERLEINNLLKLSKKSLQE